jgi:hypothetical protein
VGLTIHYARIALMLLCFVVLVISMVVLPLVAALEISRAARSGEGPGAGLVLATIPLLLVNIAMNFLAPLLGLSGSILCLWVPSQSGAKGFIIASLTLDLVALPVGLLLRLLSLFPEGQLLAVLGVVPAFLMGFIAWALFMVFLQKLSSYFHEETLAEEAQALLIRGIVILVLAPVVFFILLGLALLPCIGFIFVLMVLGYSLYYFFLFLRRQLDLIGSLRQVIASYG